MAPRQWDTRRALLGGVAAGLFAGFVTWLIGLITHVARGQDVWLGMKGAAIPFLGERATQPGFDGPAVILGLLCHFGISAIWGALFGILAYGLGRGATLVLGAGWGLVVWLVMLYIVLPAVGMGEAARSTPMGWAILEHVIFGLSVAIGFLPYQRPIRRGRVAPRWQPR